MRNSKSIAAIASLIALALMFIPASAAGQTTEEIAVKQALESAGITVEKLMVIPVEGIVIVRGQVTPGNHARLGQVLKDMDLRIANLVKIVAMPDDQKIELDAERALHQTRAMEGSRLRIHSIDGVVTLEGTVRHELQRDAAVSILRGVDGVKQVHTAVQKI